MENAPLLTEIADGPDTGRGYWLTADDGLRLRIGYWPGGDKGTVLLFPGRTEYVEKYGRAARDLAARGYGTLAVDWRGQGMADRLLQDPAKGHVTRFEDYQKDIHAVMAALPYLGVDSARLYMMAHSMGGCIGLRALHGGLPVRAAVFSAPMWGLPVGLPARLAAQFLVSLGFGRHYTPGSGASESHASNAPFDGNTLTSDREMFDYMQHQTKTHPELALGAPTLQWAAQALSEMRALSVLPAPKVATLCFLGQEERIVSASAIRQRMADWPDGQLREFDIARHEVMMETRPIQAAFFDESCALFDAH